VFDAKPLENDGLFEMAEIWLAIGKGFKRESCETMTVVKDTLMLLENIGILTDCVDDLTELPRGVVEESEYSFEESGTKAPFVDVKSNSEDDGMSRAEVICDGRRSKEVLMARSLPDEEGMLGADEVTKDTRASGIDGPDEPAEVRSVLVALWVEKIIARICDRLTCVPERVSAVSADVTLGRRTNTVSSGLIVGVIVALDEAAAVIETVESRDHSDSDSV
jgi:hypothetical protein